MEEITGDIEREGEINLELEPDLPDNPEASPATKENGEDNTPQEGVKETPAKEKKESKEELPFHKHPRWKKLNESNKEMKARLEQMEAQNTSLMDEMKNRFKPEGSKQPIPEWFRELFGESEEAWQKYQAQTQSDRESIKKEVLEEIAKNEQAKTQEQQHWEGWIQEELANLEEDGQKFDRPKFMKFMLDYTPTDDKGNLDFKKGIKLFSQLESSKVVNKTEEKKKIASNASPDTKAQPSNSGVKTWADTMRTGWN